MKHAVWNYTSGGALGAVTVTLAAAPNGSIARNWLSGLQIKAGANALVVTIQCDGVTLYEDSLQANERLMGILCDAPLVGVAGQALTLTTSATGAYVNAQGFIE